MTATEFSHLQGPKWQTMEGVCCSLLCITRCQCHVKVSTYLSVLCLQLCRRGITHDLISDSTAYTIK